MSSFSLICGWMDFFEQPIYLEQLCGKLSVDMESNIQGPLLPAWNNFNPRMGR